MEKVRAFKATAAGVVAMLIAHATAPLHREEPPMDQAALAAYLAPTAVVEPDPLGRLRAQQIAIAAPMGQGSNTSAFAQVAAGWGAALNATVASGPVPDK